MNIANEVLEKSRSYGTLFQLCISSNVKIQSFHGVPKFIFTDNSFILAYDNNYVEAYLYDCISSDKPAWVTMSKLYLKLKTIVLTFEFKSINGKMTQDPEERLWGIDY